MPEKLRRSTIRHIEAEINNYHRTLEYMEQLHRDVIFAGMSRSFVTPGGAAPTTSVVERRATRLADSLLLREMERVTTAIRAAYARTKDEARRVIWLKYGLAIDWEIPADLRVALDGRNRLNMRTREMARIAGVDESTFYRYRLAFVSAIAEQLGWY